MIRFVQCATGEILRVLSEYDGGLWLISHTEPAAPFFVASANGLERIETPALFLTAQKRPLTQAEEKRLALIQPMLDDEQCIADKGHRLSIAKEISANSETTTKRVLRIFYRYLAKGELGSHPDREPKKRPDFDWVIQHFYYSAKRLSLRTTYDILLVQKYTNSSGQLLADAPSWNSFQRYFYSNNYHKKPEKIIARTGLSHYQRNHRSAFGDASEWRPHPGCFQMDATIADIYLVSRFDHSTVIGRPSIYLAVDTATQLVVGVHVGLESDETAVMKCLANAAADKVAYCKRFGIEITADQWPNIGLPDSIVTDKGREFFGPRMNELCQRYGVEVESLPPFRPDRKGLVEKAFDLLQQRYKPLLRGKGIIEPDAQERWAVDYRSQAMLNIDEFTAILLHCVIYCNAGRLLSGGKTPAQKWIDANPSLLTTDLDELHHFTLPRTTVKLTRTGIAFNGMNYAPANLDSLHIGDRYEIIYDPADSSCIFICQDQCFLRANLVSKFSELRGLSMPEIQMLKQTKRKERQTARHHETATSVATIQAVQNIIRAAEQQREGIQGSLTGAEVNQNRKAEKGRLT